MAAQANSVGQVYRAIERGYGALVDADSSRRQWAIDLVLCALLLTFGVLITSERPGSSPVDLLMFPPLILPVLLRRYRPLAAAVALAAGAVWSGLPLFDQFRFPVVLPIGLLVVYPLARNTARRPAIAGLALVLGSMVFIGLTDPGLDGEGGVGGMIVFSFPLYIGVWAGGRLVRAGDLLAAELDERSRSLERQREQTAALAVEVERTQVASQLDVAARARIREMIELAGAGQRASDAPPVFARIERTARESLNEMRGLLGVLRSDERGARSPRPTLAQLENLLAEARRGGRLVELEIEGERRALPGGVELAAYRVLQHALVAVRGENGEPAKVELRYMPRALALEVSGFPTSGSGAEAAMVAARERATLRGGSFAAESPSPGRRVLRVHLPTPAANV